MTTPYATTTSGTRARDEIIKILRHFGCEKVGFMDEFEDHALMLAFVWRGRQVQLRASAEGWASAYIKENPWRSSRHSTRLQWESRALDQGMIAINSILRDWVKGQVTAVETGIMSFETVFMPHMLTQDGTPMLDQMRKLLPPPVQQ